MIMEDTHELKPHEIVIFKERIYRVEESKYSNGKMQGHRVILKLLKEKELHKMFLEKLKGGLK